MEEFLAEVARKRAVVVADRIMQRSVVFRLAKKRGLLRHVGVDASEAVRICFAQRSLAWGAAVDLNNLNYFGSNKCGVVGLFEESLQDVWQSFEDMLRRDLLKRPFHGRAYLHTPKDKRRRTLVVVPSPFFEVKITHRPNDGDSLGFGRSLVKVTCRVLLEIPN